MKCNTAGIDSVRFFSFCKRGDILLCNASVNKAWTDSLEVGVKVIAEDFRTLEKKHILSAYFIFESEEENSFINFIICENKIQKKRYFEAEKRKNKNCRIKKKLVRQFS